MSTSFMVIRNNDTFTYKTKPRSCPHTILQIKISDSNSLLLKSNTFFAIHPKSTDPKQLTQKENKQCLTFSLGRLRLMESKFDPCLFAFSDPAMVNPGRSEAKHRIHNIRDDTSFRRLHNKIVNLLFKRLY